MTEQPPAARDSYSPQLRTALVLTGSGTAGAYHAGVLRAVQEAGVKIDLLAGAGMGAVSALFGAIDGAERLWQPDGFWARRRAARFYGVRPALRLLAWALAAAWSVVLMPFLALVAGLVIYPAGFLLGVLGVPSGSTLAQGHQRIVATAFDPGFLPALLPRALTICLAAFLAVLALALLIVMVGGRGRRRDAAPVWWRIAGAPLNAAPAAAAAADGIWRIIGGATGARRPPTLDLSRTYAELLRDNLGQPGFRELLLTIHDLDVRRDLVFALIGERYRRDFFRARAAGDRRQVECFDLAGVARDQLLDAVRAALTFPTATEVASIGFPPESFWCGEVHRVCERPGAVDRLLDELPAAGIEQVILVSAFPELEGPHRLGIPRGDWRGRLGDGLAGIEAAAMRSASAGGHPFRSLFVVRPAYNPVGPLDVTGRYDERSDRFVSLAEVADRGYEDAYRQFIDPVVGASGERLETAGGRRGV